MKIKEIDFQYNDNIHAISKKQFDVHMKLYKGYIDTINDIDSILLRDGERKDSNATYSKYRGLKKGESYALDGVLLHEQYFENIGGGTPGRRTMEIFEREFGGYQKWVKDFKACAMSARGWCVLAYEQRTETFRNLLQDSHDDGVVLHAFPILVLDMYEHAYYIDYANKKAEYIDGFLQNINWHVVEKRIGVVCVK